MDGIKAVPEHKEYTAHEYEQKQFIGVNVNLFCGAQKKRNIDDLHTELQYPEEQSYISNAPTKSIVQ